MSRAWLGLSRGVVEEDEDGVQEGKATIGHVPASAVRETKPLKELYLCAFVFAFASHPACRSYTTLHEFLSGGLERLSGSA